MTFISTQGIYLLHSWKQWEHSVLMLANTQEKANKNKVNSVLGCSKPLVGPTCTLDIYYKHTTGDQLDTEHLLKPSENISTTLQTEIMVSIKTKESTMSFCETCS